eukprot:8271028-Ditylum_brightwellii.AAC.1
MQQYIGKFGTDRGATEILEGELVSKQFTNLPVVNYWIKNNIRRVAAAHSVDISLPVEELKQLLTKQNENTSPLPSGHHYGHYKVLIHHEDILE